jgi:hypothetical protein
MGPLAIAQYMVAATFFSVALMHFLVWYRNTYYRVHLLFALTALTAGANSIAEAGVYSATTLDTFIPAFKWYVTFSALWLIAFIWFVGVWTGISAIRRRWLITLSAVFCAALVINFLAPCGILFTEITQLRQVQLSWGDQIALPEGLSSPWRYGTDIAMIGVLVLVVDGWRNLRQQGKQRSAWLLGGSLLLFFLFFLSMLI